MSNFDWYSEEEVGWDDEPKPVIRPPRPPRHWSRWILVVLILITSTGTAAATVYRRLSQRVEEASFAVEANIRDSYDIVYQSAQTADRDLFVTFLSGRDASWASAQERVIASGLFYARPGFGLQWLPEDAETAVSAVEISPDLTTAVVTSTHHYALDVGNHISQTVALQQTDIYRLGPDRWLISPPLPEFWGETQTSAGSLLTLTYPEHDAAIANRLAVDLEAKINELCARLTDIACADDLHVNVSFSTNPAAVFESNQLPSNVTITAPRMRTLGWYSFPARLGEHTLTLPTPSLLGVPIDEAGYQAIYRGYAARVVSAVIAEQVSWQCCMQAALFQALLDMQLAQLGLKPWPLTAADYDRVLQMPITTVDQTWHNVEIDALDDIRSLYVMVDFLVQDVGTSVVAMQHALVEVPVEQWLQRVVGDVYPTAEDLQRGWLHYIYGRSQIAQTQPKAPWPQQDLLLVCRPHASQTSFVYQYNVAANDSHVVRALARETGVILPISAEQGWIVAEEGAGSSSFIDTFIWQAGHERLVDRQTTTANHAAVPIAVSTDNLYAVFMTADRNVIPYALLDLTACEENGQCALQSLLGEPIWSPDGSQTVLLGNAIGDAGDTLLFLGDAQGQNITLIGEGKRPFWANEQQVAYIAANHLSVFTATNASETTLFSLDEVVAAAQIEASTNVWQMQYVMQGKSEDDWFLVVKGTSGRQNANYLLHYDRTNNKATSLYTWNNQLALEQAFSHSPDGRWLLLFSFDVTTDSWFLYLYDIVAGHETIYNLADLAAVPDMSRMFDWSPNGQWLAMTYNGYVRLIALSTLDERWFFPDRMACDQAVWIK